MHVSAQMVQQWICEWLLTSAVIYVIKCAWSNAVDPLDIHQNLVANTRLKQSAMLNTRETPRIHLVWVQSTGGGG